MSRFGQCSPPARRSSAGKLGPGLLVLALAGSPAVAATYTVNDLGDFHDDLPGDGVCTLAALDASCSLRAAIEEANAHAGTDTILFQAGLSGTIDVTLGLLSISESLNIFGPGRDVLTVDAQGSSGIFFFTGVSLQLSGLTITGSAGSGGAVDIRPNADSVQLSNLRLDHNTASSGGAVSTMASTPLTELILENVELDSNSATSSGGAIYVNAPGSALYITDCSFSDNWSGDPASGTGGAVTVRVTGGASVEIERSLFSGNHALGESSGGGGLYLQEEGAGTLDLSVNRSAFINNGADNGGALFLTDASATVTNSTFSGNEGSGSAVLGLGATVTVLSSTIAGNTGGVALLNAASTLEIGHTLVANSVAACSGTVTSLGYNVATGTACHLDQAGDLDDTDPLLGSLVWLGHSAPAHVPYTVSPAVDGGAAGGCPAPFLASLTTLADDQWGQSRPWDGDADTVAVCDRGAVETRALLYDGFETGGFDGWTTSVP